jgi:hypothetical protein
MDQRMKLHGYTVYHIQLPRKDDEDNYIMSKSCPSFSKTPEQFGGANSNYV